MSPGRLTTLVTSAVAVVVLLCAGAVGSCAPMAALIPPACLHPTGPPPSTGPDTPAPVCIPSVARFDHDQVANAALIVEVGTDMDVPVWGQVIAVAVAMQESGLRNLDHGDRDSLGLFQQRPSQGWGTPAQILDPRHAARAFYQALLLVDGWQQLDLAHAAQAVQHSAHPEAYTRWTADAATLVTTLNPQAAGWVAPVAAPVVSGYRTPDRPDHLGADLGADRGQIVVAAAAGTVATVACQARHLGGNPYGCHRDGHPHRVVGCGWYLDITHPGNTTTRYCHLHTRPWVEQGQQVVAGQPIGQVGSTGRSSGPHLHYEIWATTDTGQQAPQDPEMWMRRHGAPLPTG